MKIDVHVCVLEDLYFNFTASSHSEFLIGENLVN